MSQARMLGDDDCCGQMAMAITPEGVPKVGFLIKKDQKITYTEIQDIMKISSHFAQQPWHKETYLLDEQKWGRVGWCTHILISI